LDGSILSRHPSEADLAAQTKYKRKKIHCRHCELWLRHYAPNWKRWK